MAFHPAFPASPYDPLLPEYRWFAQWCEDATAAVENGIRYDFLYVDQDSFEKHKPQSLADLAASFTQYKS